MNCFKKWCSSLLNMLGRNHEIQVQKLIIPGIIESRQLKLQTRAGNDICNCQTSLINEWEKHQFKEYEVEFKDVRKRTNPTAIYNCHGLSFASRRTSISDIKQVIKIVEEDQYEEIKNHDDVLPGDIILYHNAGDIEHSGVVISKPEEAIITYPYKSVANVSDSSVFGQKPARLKFPKIYSKWGKYCECIHFANQCPYYCAELKYYRIVK